MTILFLMLIVATWVLGTYEGDHTAAVFLSLWGVCGWWTSVKEKKKAGALRKYAGDIFLERIALRRATIKGKPMRFSTKGCNKYGK